MLPPNISLILAFKICYLYMQIYICTHLYFCGLHRLIWWSRLKNGRPSLSTQPGASANTLELLRDGDQPFIYDIRFSRKTFTLELYDTSNPNQHWSTLKPDVVVLAFDISNRETLDGLKAVRITYTYTRSRSLIKAWNIQWRNDITRYFQYGHGERLPVMLLGLKRDLRREGPGIIYPQEVCYYQQCIMFLLWLTDGSRLIALLKNFVVIGMPSVRLWQASCLQRRSKISQGWRRWRLLKRVGRPLVLLVLSYELILCISYPVYASAIGYVEQWSFLYAHTSM